MIPEHVCVFHFQVLRTALPAFSSREWFGFASRSWKRPPLWLHSLSYVTLLWLSSFQPKSSSFPCGIASPHSTGHLSSHFRHLLGRRQLKKCGLSFSGLLLHARRRADRTEVTRREAWLCRAGDCSDQAKNISSFARNLMLLIFEHCGVFLALQYLPFPHTEFLIRSP
jgi:hypothetical protein